MDPEHEGTIYGFEVRSEIPLWFLRPGHGTPFTVQRGEVSPARGDMLYEWSGIPRSTLTVRLSQLADTQFLIEFGDDEAIQLDLAHSACLLYPGREPSDILREGMLWSTPAAVAITSRGDLSMHAASVDVGGQAILLAASGTYGKTTLAGALHGAGHRLLSDDMTCISLYPKPRVWPGPTVVRARRDVVDSFTFHRTHPILHTREKTFFSLDRDTRGTGDPVPLKAAIFLRTVEEGIRLEPAEPSEALRDVFGLSFFMPTDAGRAQCFELAAALTAEVPVWDLSRPLTIESLPAVIDTVISALG